MVCILFASLSNSEWATGKLYLVQFPGILLMMEPENFKQKADFLENDQFNDLQTFFYKCFQQI